MVKHSRHASYVPQHAFMPGYASLFFLTYGCRWDIGILGSHCMFGDILPWDIRAYKTYGVIYTEIHLPLSAVGHSMPGGATCTPTIRPKVSAVGHSMPGGVTCTPTIRPKVSAVGHSNLTECTPTISFCSKTRVRRLRASAPTPAREAT